MCVCVRVCVCGGGEGGAKPGEKLRLNPERKVAGKVAGKIREIPRKSRKTREN